MSESNGISTEEHPVKVRKYSRNLKVKLSDREIVERAQRAAKLAGDIEQREEESKAAMKLAKAQIDEIAAERRRLEIEVGSGETYRETSVWEETIFRLGVVREVRQDTGETISERPMSDKEKQVELPGLEGEAENDTDEAADDTEPDELTEAEEEEFVEEGGVSGKLELATEKPKAKGRGGRRKSAESEAE